MPNSVEWEYLAELIRDFPTKRKLDKSRDRAVDKAFLLLRDRTKSVASFNMFEEMGPKFFEWEIDFRIEAVETIIRAYHKVLFKRILANNGEYRKSDDPNGGKVGFGGNLRFETRLKFVGCNPEKIENCVKRAISNLFSDNADKTYNALLFYQQFVFCHPFYDANGRIARFIVTSYLRHFGIIVLWSQMEASKSQFIKRLNRCHDRFKSTHTEAYTRQMGYFVSYVKDHLLATEDLGDLEVPS